jgi:hypothetical protein
MPLLWYNRFTTTYLIPKEGQKMTENNEETIARALEIAIKLTDAKQPKLFIDENGNIFMEPSLLRNLEIVIRIMKSKNLTNICNSAGSSDNWVYSMKQ